MTATTFANGRREVPISAPSTWDDYEVWLLRRDFDEGVRTRTTALAPPRIVAATALAAALTAMPLAAPTEAHAEPVAPQAGSPCAQNLDGALTQLLNYTARVTTYLQCKNQPGVGYQWQVFDSPYPSSDRWLSFGPKLILHGEGQRNREIDSGDWVGTPQDGTSQCKAEQVAVVSAGTVGTPQVSTSEPGQPLKFALQPLLFTVELSGHCLWEKVKGPSA